MNSSLHRLSLEFVRVTELAAIEAAKWIGRGDGKAADKAAVDAMRTALNQIAFSGEIVIGEGAKDESHELYVGEKVGNGNAPEVDIAVDPLECTDSVAYGRTNAITVIATGPKGTLYKAADSYMQKLAVPPSAKNIVDLDAPVKDTIQKVAKALGKDISEITVAILDRERHEKLKNEVRSAGARLQLFTDGDVAMALATCLPESPVDILMGTGGSSEAVLAASAMRTFGGELLVRWKPKDEKHIARLNAAGITKFDDILKAEDLAKGDDLTFTATGVLTGPLAKGVVFGKNHITTHTIVISSKSNTTRFIKTKHKTS
ncbi:fructose-bisphosphatase, class II [Candidatus Jorgensenbacteria bacterium RIFCSPLOWO2_01_FULL_45_25b]|uniref:Fructose-1,6-bisphosphatase n=1 Tax=Candidatus Jorgensenbacteria bacterium RIFCSPLOWO2_01_FULL_45_25b TaxID=1798471 RepID=A0A1F6BSQ4_9BACT|nr:MAG: fructose-bisphosphatase, class II [Candidatus Jorgensenbacteria bacterium RIFCSPLOWO2_01_FULL_45_25b]